MALTIRSLHPQIETRTQKKKHKPNYLYKENRKKPYEKMKRDKTVPYVHVTYSHLSKVKRDALKSNSINHSLRATEGKTSKMRTIRRRRRKEYLRIKYKLQNRTKVCTICKRNKALSDFDYQKDKAHKNAYRRTYCYVCRKDMNAAAYQQRKQNVL